MEPIALGLAGRCQTGALGMKPTTSATRSHASAKPPAPRCSASENTSPFAVESGSNQPRPSWMTITILLSRRYLIARRVLSLMSTFQPSFSSRAAQPTFSRNPSISFLSIFLHRARRRRHPALSSVGLACSKPCGTSSTGREACRMQGRADKPSIGGSRARQSFPCSRQGASGSRSPGSMSQGPGVVFMNDGVLFAIVFAGDHDAEFVIDQKEDDRHHQRAGQIEGVILCEGEIVRHREAPVLWRGSFPPAQRRRGAVRESAPPRPP